MPKINRLLLLLGLIFCAMHAQAAVCTTLTSGASQTTVYSAITGCGSNNTVVFSAGTYGPFTSQVTIPCGVSLTGPVVPYSQTNNQTAVLTGNFGIGNYGPFVTTAGCSQSQTIEYLEWNGGYPTNGTEYITYDSESPPNAITSNLNTGSGTCQTQNHTQVPCGVGGGNFLYVTPGTQNLTVTNNYLHGNNCGFLCGDTHALLIYMPPHGGQSYSGGEPIFPSGYPVDSNITIQWNIFAQVGKDCRWAVLWNANQNTEGGGGTCDGVGMQGAFTNLFVNNNRFQTGDDELKFFEMYSAGNTAGYCSPCTFNYNHFQQFDRIAEEMQINWGGPSEPTLVYSQYSDYSNHLNPMQQDYDISMANGCVYNFNTSNQTNCVNHIDYNFTVADGGPVTGANVGYEYWAGNGSTGLGNVWVGNLAAVSFQWDPNGNYTYNNNTTMSPINGGNACNSGCSLQNGQSNPSYPGCPGAPSSGSPLFKPSCNNNYFQTSNGSITSVAPVLSSSGGSVTIANTNVSTPNGSNPGRDSNTTFWCTSNGNTPSVGNTANNGTTAYWVGAASQSVATVTPGGSGTFKCIGMWGAPNQPYSYLAASSGGGGYVPSAVASIAFSGSGSPALVSCSQTNNSPGTPINTLTVGQAVQQAASCLYSDSLVTNCTTTDSRGTAVTAWGPPSSTIISVGQIGSAHPGLVTGLAAGTASSTATVTGGLSCANYSWTVNTLPPTLSGATISLQSGGSSVTVGGNATACANINYTTPTTTTQVCGSGTDAYGTSVSNYTSSSPSNATINASTGVLTGVAIGTTSVSATTSPSTTVTPLTVNVLAPSVNPAVQIQGPVNLNGVVIQ